MFVHLGAKLRNVFVLLVLSETLKSLRVDDREREIEREKERDIAIDVKANNNNNIENFEIEMFQFTKL